MKITEYWDEKRVYIYGLLAGLTSLSPNEVVKRINELTNDQDNIKVSLGLLSSLEREQKIETSDIKIDTEKYLHQYQQYLQAQDPEDRIDDIEVLARLPQPERLLPIHDSITDLMSQKHDIIFDLLAHCLSFKIEVIEPDLIANTFNEYLNAHKSGQINNVGDEDFWSYNKQRLRKILPVSGESDMFTLMDLFDDWPHFNLLETLFTMVIDEELVIEDLEIIDKQGLSGKLFIIPHVHVPSNAAQHEVTDNHLMPPSMESNEASSVNTDVDFIPDDATKIGNLLLFNGSIECNGKDMDLQTKEYKVLERLMTKYPNIVTHTTLRNLYWKREMDEDDKILDTKTAEDLMTNIYVCVNNIRTKLDFYGADVTITTKPKNGYVLQLKT
jgi:DNA-binding winged helix-turn-helix (wHTH) protein